MRGQERLILISPMSGWRWGGLKPAMTVPNAQRRLRRATPIIVRAGFSKRAVEVAQRTGGEAVPRFLPMLGGRGAKRRRSAAVMGGPSSMRADLAAGVPRGAVAPVRFMRPKTRDGAGQAIAPSAGRPAIR